MSTPTPIALIIADLGLPDGDGVDFIREVRIWSGVPIIVLSARTHEREKVAALEAGADDYLTKPFGVAELLARTRAKLRRVRAARAAPDSTFRFGDVEVDLAARIAKKCDVEVHLTLIEYRLLGVLIANAGRVLTHPGDDVLGLRRVILALLPQIAQVDPQVVCALRLAGQPAASVQVEGRMRTWCRAIRVPTAMALSLRKALSPSIHRGSSRPGCGIEPPAHALSAPTAANTNPRRTPCQAANTTLAARRSASLRAGCRLRFRWAVAKMPYKRLSATCG